MKGLTNADSETNKNLMNIETEKEFEISTYLRILNRNKFTIIIIALICLASGTYIAQNTKPIYNATAKILADPYQPNADREEQYIASAMVFLFFETQYEIIRSRVIAEKVVERLNLVEKLKIERAKNQPKTTFIKQIKDTVKSAIGYENKETKELTDEELSVFLADKISANIVVTGGRKNQIITINYQANDPQEAADIINALSDAYIEFGLTSRLTDVQNQQKWLTTQYEQLKNNLVESEKRVKEYQESQGLIHSYQQRALANNQLQSLNTNLVKAQTELSIQTEQFELIKAIKNGSKNFSSLNQIIQDDTLNSLIQDETQKQNKVNELFERYGELHPKMIAARSELKNAQNNLKNSTSKIIQRVENQYNLAKLQVTNINNLIDDTKSDVRSIQDESASLVSLEREVENNRRIYEAFQSRLLEANIKGEISASNVHIIDRATVPRIPVSPNVKKIILISLMVGVFLGVIVSFLREMLNNTFRTPDLLEEKLKLPMLGITPFVKAPKNTKGPEQQYLEDTRSPFSESINTIRTGIIFSNIDNPPKTILVTSATGSEGKSTLAMNLAASLSNVGKTLLLEVDLRKPSISKNLELGKSQGLTELLSGAVKSLNDITHKLNDDQLDIITCGAIPQNPMEILSSNKFEKLLKSLAEHYEHIILDGPPTLPVSDSCIVANKVDGVIVSVRAEQTKIKVAKEAVTRLQKLNANIVGVVLTVAELKKMSYYGDHYYAGEYYGVKPEKDA